MLSDLLWFVRDVPVHLTDITDTANISGITECNAHRGISKALDIYAQATEPSVFVS